METSCPVAKASVPQFTGSAPQRKSVAAGCNYHMPMCTGSFSYTQSGLVSLSAIPIRRSSSDMMSPFPPSGNEG